MTSEKVTRKTTTRRRSIPRTAGQRLTQELSRSSDPFSIRLLIERAAHTADWLEQCTELLNGKPERLRTALSVSQCVVPVVAVRGVAARPAGFARPVVGELAHCGGVPDRAAAQLCKRRRERGKVT